MNYSTGLPHISFSLLAVKKDKRISFIKENNKFLYVDYLHIDVSDLESSLSLKEIQLYKKISKVPLDIHIAKKNPIIFLKKLKLTKYDKCCVHVENNLRLNTIKEFNKKFQFGLAINLETKVSKLTKYLKFLDYILFMSSVPGVSGLSFNDKVIKKIKSLRKINNKIKLHADGGVNNVNAALLREEKIDVIISGSYLMKSRSIKKQLSLLLGGDYFKNISYFSSKKIPKLNIESRIIDALKIIDKYKMGIVLIFYKNILKGLVSDGDIRRYLISGGSVYDSTNLIINKKIITLKNFSMIHSLRIIKNMRNVSAIPIVNEKGKCISIFKGLIK